MDATGEGNMSNSDAAERQILKAALVRTEQCLSLEALTAVGDNSADPAMGSTAMRHLKICAYCRNELLLLQEFEAAEATPEEAGQVAWIESQLSRRAHKIGRTRSLRSLGVSWLASLFPVQNWRPLTLVATSLLLAVGAGFYLQQQRPRIESASPLVYRSLEFRAISPVGDVSGAPAQFSWQSVAGAAKYQLRLMQVDQTEVWSVETNSTTVPVPPELRKNMTPGRGFSWIVIARNSAGEKIAETNLQKLHINIADASAVPKHNY
jgi:hypothetical protein